MSFWQKNGLTLQKASRRSRFSSLVLTTRSMHYYRKLSMLKTALLRLRGKLRKWRSGLKISRSILRPKAGFTGCLGQSPESEQDQILPGHLNQGIGQDLECLSWV